MAQITIDTAAVARFCHKHHIKRLALFGSVLRDDFSPQSDVDVLVEFDSGQEPGLLRLANMERELSPLLGGRKVDLRTPQDFESLLPRQGHGVSTGLLCKRMIASDFSI